MNGKLFAVMNAAGDFGEPATIICFGPIGAEYAGERGAITSQDFKTALDAIPAGKAISLRINSQGGNLWEGLAIYNMLRLVKDRVTSFVDGVCASAATVIALGGNRVVMPKSSLFMIHKPRLSTSGDADLLRQEAAKLDRHEDILVGIYGQKTGKNSDELRGMMARETWMDGSEAFGVGFADELVEDSTQALAQLKPGDIIASGDMTLIRRTAAAVEAYVSDREEDRRRVPVETSYDRQWREWIEKTGGIFDRSLFRYNPLA